MNIGVVEDDLSNLAYLQTLLTLQGHQVFAHREAHSFLETVRNTYQQDGVLPYGLALLDLILPGSFSGLDIIHELRGMETSFKRLPIIVISATSQCSLDALQFSFPAIPILRKPFHMRDLLALVDGIDSAREAVRVE